MSTFDVPKLKNTGEEGWVDLEFFAKLYKEAEDSFLIGAGAIHEGEAVGFGVLFPKAWTHDPHPDMPPGVAEYSAGMALLGLEPVQGAFLKCLASLYEVPIPDEGMAEFVEVSAVCLEGNPYNILTEPVHLKIFFGAFEDSPAPYAEAYLNIDLKGGIIQLHEKDTSYRGAIIQALMIAEVEGGIQ
jgi:hypothetical protein